MLKNEKGSWEGRRLEEMDTGFSHLRSNSSLVLFVSFTLV